MAKRRKMKRTARRRRSVGAINKSLLMNGLFAIGGGVAAGFISKFASSINITGNAKTDGMIQSLLPVAAGLGVAAFMGKKDSKFMFLGMGMAAAGGVNAARSLGIISGVPLVAGLGRPQVRRLNGVGNSSQQRTPLIAGTRAAAIAS